MVIKGHKSGFSLTTIFRHAATLLPRDEGKKQATLSTSPGIFQYSMADAAHTVVPKGKGLPQESAKKASISICAAGQLTPACSRYSPG